MFIDREDQKQAGDVECDVEHPSLVCAESVNDLDDSLISFLLCNYLRGLLRILSEQILNTTIDNSR